jgi:acylphosphatase
MSRPREKTRKKTREGIGGEPLVDVQLTALVNGYVQGVGFRWWTRSRALELRLTGYATNLPDGRVQVVAQGPRERCQRLLDLLEGGNTPGAVDAVVVDWSAATAPLNGFSAR